MSSSSSLFKKVDASNYITAKRQMTVSNEFVKANTQSQFVPLNSKLVIHLYDHPNRIINNKEPGNYLHKNLRDNLNNINELNYEIVRNSVSDTPMDSETSTKISSIEQNEYMINILHFRTLVNPANELFYTQNTFYNGKLKPDQIENEIRRNRWSLKF